MCQKPTISYPTFGSAIMEMQYASDTNGSYRFGFNGEEKMDEISEEGLAYDLGARFYDSRLGRMFSLDPMMNNYPYWSPYSYSCNNPILVVDIKGMEPPGKSYTVKKGDNPEKIAKLFGVSIWDIAKSNQGKQEGGGFFNSIGKGSYKDYWVNGKGTQWKIVPGDVLTIPDNSVKETPINTTATITLKITIYDPQGLIESYKDDYINTFKDECTKFYNLSGSKEMNTPWFYDGSGKSGLSRNILVNYNIITQFDIQYTKTIEGVSNNSFIMLVKASTNEPDKDGRKVAGINYGGCAVVTPQNTGLLMVMLMLHEFTHDMDLIDAYTAEFDALGNLMGVVQNIRNVSLTVQQQEDLAIRLLALREAMVKYGGNIYDETAKKRAKRAQDRVTR